MARIVLRQWALWAAAALILFVYIGVLRVFWPTARRDPHPLQLPRYKFAERHPGAAAEAAAAMQAILRKTPYEPPKRDQPHNFKGEHSMHPRQNCTVSTDASHPTLSGKMSLL